MKRAISLTQALMLDLGLPASSNKDSNEKWRDIAENLRVLSEKQLELVSHFIKWVSEQDF